MSDQTVNLLITLVVAIISSTALSSIVIAWLGRRREKQEIANLMIEGDKTEAEIQTISAEAYTLWMQANVELQKQRQADIDFYTAKLEEVKVDYEGRLEASETRKAEEVERVRAELSKEIESLKSRVRTLENERNQLLVEAREKDKKLAQQLSEIAALKERYGHG